MEIPKGWIVLNILSFESKEDRDISEMLNKEANKEFKKSAIQIINIGAIDLESEGFTIDNSNTFVQVQGNFIEVKESYEEIFKLIKEDYERTN